MPNESAYVQVAVDGTGKKVANVSVTEPQAVDASGNAQADLVRYQQVVTAASPRGDVGDTTLADIGNALDEMNDTLHAILAALS